MKKILFIITVFCLTASATIYAQGTKVGLVDIQKLLVETPYGIAYNEFLNDQMAKYGPNGDTMRNINEFLEGNEELQQVLKEIATEKGFDMIVISRKAEINIQDSYAQNKLVYRNMPLVGFLQHGYFSEQLDITDEVSKKLMTLIGR